VPWLSGIQDYASHTAPTQASPAVSTPLPAAQIVDAGSAPDALNTNATPYPQAAQHSVPAPQAPGQHFQVPGPQPAATQPAYTGWPGSGVQQAPIQLSAAPQTQPPPPPPAPTIREQAQRSLVILEEFAELDNNNPTTKRSTKLTASSLEPTVPATILLPESYPSFTPEESKYLLARQRRARANADSLMPPAPAKQLCAITSWNAKYRDPKTGLHYADMHIYKIIQRVLAGGCQWSGLLGCWVGPTYGSMGRPARGVPDGFAGPSAPVVAGKEKGVKSEGAVEKST